MYYIILHFLVYFSNVKFYPPDGGRARRKRRNCFLHKICKNYGNSIPSPLLGLVRNALQFLAHNTLQKTLGQIDGAYVKKH